MKLGAVVWFIAFAARTTVTSDAIIGLQDFVFGVRADDEPVPAARLGPAENVTYGTSSLLEVSAGDEVPDGLLPALDVAEPNGTSSLAEVDVDAGQAMAVRGHGCEEGTFAIDKLYCAEGKGKAISSGFGSWDPVVCCTKLKGISARVTQDMIHSLAPAVPQGNKGAIDAMPALQELQRVVEIYRREFYGNEMFSGSRGMEKGSNGEEDMVSVLEQAGMLVSQLVQDLVKARQSAEQITQLGKKLKADFSDFLGETVVDAEIQRVVATIDVKTAAQSATASLVAKKKAKIAEAERRLEALKAALTKDKTTGLPPKDPVVPMELLETYLNEISNNPTSGELTLTRAKDAHGNDVLLWPGTKEKIEEARTLLRTKINELVEAKKAKWNEEYSNFLGAKVAEVLPTEPLNANDLRSRISTAEDQLAATLRTYKTQDEEALGVLVQACKQNRETNAVDALPLAGKNLEQHLILIAQGSQVPERAGLVWAGDTAKIQEAREEVKAVLTGYLQAKLDAAHDMYDALLGVERVEHTWAMAIDEDGNTIICCKDDTPSPPTYCRTRRKLCNTPPHITPAKGKPPTKDACPALCDGRTAPATVGQLDIPIDTGDDTAKTRAEKAMRDLKALATAAEGANKDLDARVGNWRADNPATLVALEDILNVENWPGTPNTFKEATQQLPEKVQATRNSLSDKYKKHLVANFVDQKLASVDSGATAITAEKELETHKTAAVEAEQRFGELLDAAPTPDALNALELHLESFKAYAKWITTEPAAVDRIAPILTAIKDSFKTEYAEFIVNNKLQEQLALVKDSTSAKTVKTELARMKTDAEQADEALSREVTEFTMEKLKQKVEAAQSKVTVTKNVKKAKKAKATATTNKFLTDFINLEKKLKAFEASDSEWTGTPGKITVLKPKLQTFRDHFGRAVETEFRRFATSNWYDSEAVTAAIHKVTQSLEVYSTVKEDLFKNAKNVAEEELKRLVNALTTGLGAETAAANLQEYLDQIVTIGKKGGKVTIKKKDKDGVVWPGAPAKIKNAIKELTDNQKKIAKQKKRNKADKAVASMKAKEHEDELQANAAHNPTLQVTTVLTVETRDTTTGPRIQVVSSCDARCPHETKLEFTEDRAGETCACSKGVVCGNGDYCHMDGSCSQHPGECTGRDGNTASAFYPCTCGTKTCQPAQPPPPSKGKKGKWTYQLCTAKNKCRNAKYAQTNKPVVEVDANFLTPGDIESDPCTGGDKVPTLESDWFTSAQRGSHEHTTAKVYLNIANRNGERLGKDDNSLQSAIDDTGKLTLKKGESLVWGSD